MTVQAPTCFGAVTGVLGYCIAYFLVVKVKSPRWRLVLFLAFIIPFWTSTLIRAIAWVPFLGVNGVINQTLMFVGATNSPIEAFLYSLTGITMAQVSLYTMMAAGPDAKRPPHIVLPTMRFLPPFLTLFLATRIHPI